MCGESGSRMTPNFLRPSASATVKRIDFCRIQASLQSELAGVNKGLAKDIISFILHDGNIPPFQRPKTAETLDKFGFMDGCECIFTSLNLDKTREHLPI